MACSMAFSRRQVSGALRPTGLNYHSLECGPAWATTTKPAATIKLAHAAWPTIHNLGPGREQSAHESDGAWAPGPVTITVTISIPVEFPMPKKHGVFEA
jgi:hypothetical protein